jgi:hypothetical protein
MQVLTTALEKPSVEQARGLPLMTCLACKCSPQRVRFSVEQARQGVAVIRRFFGFSKKKETDESAEPPLPPLQKGQDTNLTKLVDRPKGRADNAPSRHDWAPPGAIILLFNCHKAAYGALEGSQDLSTIPSHETIELLATFNLQVRSPLMMATLIAI